MLIQNYTLKEIANCNLKDKEKSVLWIPPIQRGLVWKARQTELLWDSILSGYPIGSFLVIKKEKDQSSGQLLDGQQRVNAIIQGFSSDSILNKDKDLNSILWIDLDFEQTEDRNFGIRLTNKAQPWGYELDGRLLSTAERRNSMEQANIRISITDRVRPDVREMWPNRATLPVPLPFLIEPLFKDDIQTPDDYATNVISLCERFGKFSPVWAELFIEEAKRKISAFYNVLYKIKTYTVNGNVAVLESKERIELLFNRINTGGTSFSQDELAYAVVKLYWPEIKEINQKVAYRCTTEARFAQMVFRMYNIHSTGGKYSLSGEINAKHIRKYKHEESQGFINDVVNAYNNGEIAKIQDQIDRWLIGTGNDRLPYIVRTEIANRTPEVYILLMRLAKYRVCGNKFVHLSDDYVRGLALYLYCFKRKDRGVGLLYSTIVERAEKGEEITEEEVSKILSDYTDISFFQTIDDMSVFKGFKVEMNADWNLNNFNQEQYFETVRNFFSFNSAQSFMMLLVALRKFYLSYFPDYNPAQRVLWGEDNRPWDRDHIVPNEWQYNRRGEWKNFIKEWIDSSGNRADIPFEVNRSKGNRCDWDFYLNTDNKNLLCFKDDVSVLTADSVMKKEGAQLLASLTFSRFCELYGEFYRFIKPLGLSTVLSDRQIARKRFLTEIERRLNEGANDNERFRIRAVVDQKEITFPEDDAYYWRISWLSISRAINDTRIEALTVGLWENSCFLEKGVRKHWSLRLNESEGNTWWPGNVVTLQSDTLDSVQVKEFTEDWIISTLSSSDKA